jgi:hypothetical protein
MWGCTTREGAGVRGVGACAEGGAAEGAPEDVVHVCARAAVVAGEEVGGLVGVSEVDVLGKGSGMWVAMNVW